MATGRSFSGQFESTESGNTSHGSSNSDSSGHLLGSDLGYSMSDKEEGYDFEFVPERDEKYVCPICLLVLREPVQTECGHRFCRACIMKWIRTSQARCPVDNFPLQELQVYPDNFAKREILALNVRCPNSSKGCDQVIVLNYLQDHLSKCDFSLVPCPNNCTNVLMRRDIGAHTRSKCPRRIVLCPSCQNTVIAEELHVHKKQCPQGEVSCELCKAKLKRHELDTHHRLECPLAVTDCEYRFLGCNFQIERCKMNQHTHAATQYHMALMKNTLIDIAKFLRIKVLEEPTSIHRPSSLGFQPMESSAGASAMLGLGGPRQNSSLPSTEQTNLHMMKAICEQSGLANQMGSLHIGANQSVESTAGMVPVSVPSIVVDDALQQGGGDAFQHQVSEERIPSGRTHEGSQVSYTSKPSQDNEGGATVGFLDQIQLHSLKSQNDYQDESLARHEQTLDELVHRNEVLEKMNKELKVRVKTLEGSVNEVEGRCCNGLYMWRIKEYAKLRREAERGEMTAIHSPPFYSSCFGYKLCMRVNLNGVDSARGTHLSIFIHFMQGDFDNILEWPFSGKIILSVMDQNPVCEMRHHVSETLFAKPNLAAFQKPTSSRNHKGFGYMEFLPLNVVDSSSYVLNDTLIIKAHVIPTVAN